LLSGGVLKGLRGAFWLSIGDMVGCGPVDPVNQNRGGLRPETFGTRIASPLGAGLITPAASFIYMGLCRVPWRVRPALSVIGERSSRPFVAGTRCDRAHWLRGGRTPLTWDQNMNLYCSGGVTGAGILADPETGTETETETEVPVFPAPWEPACEGCAVL
jgi:hypothetical protein